MALSNRLRKLEQHVRLLEKPIPKTIILRLGQYLADEKQKAGISENEIFFLVTLKL